MARVPGSRLVSRGVLSWALPVVMLATSAAPAGASPGSSPSTAAPGGPAASAISSAPAGEEGPDAVVPEEPVGDRVVGRGRYHALTRNDDGTTTARFSPSPMHALRGRSPGCGRCGRATRRTGRRARRSPAARPSRAGTPAASGRPRPRGRRSASAGSGTGPPHSARRCARRPGIRTRSPHELRVGLSGAVAAPAIGQRRRPSCHAALLTARRTLVCWSLTSAMEALMS